MAPSAGDGASRLLAIGVGDADDLARRLGARGMLIAFEGDPRRAELARESFARAGVGDRAHVMVGDPALLLSKVAGPFDVIVVDGDARPRLAGRLAPLLRQGGVVVTR
jgi:predicted O-methyltransferase YrrM